MALYRDKGFPAFPGAYIINSGNGGSYPIYKSTPNLGATGSIGADQANDFLLVMPGYKITVYTDTNYGTTNVKTIDNTTSSNIYHVATTGATWVNNISSIKLFYGSTEIN
jgi:hypothetical protein